MRIGIVTFLLWLPACAAPAKPLDGPALTEALDQVLNQHPTAQRTTVTLKVVDLESGDVLYDRGGDRLLTPASNLKIYTSACALDLFGPEQRFETKVSTHAPLRGGELRGNIHLVGGGDAMLSAAELRQLAKRVVSEWRLKEITGSVLTYSFRYRSPLKGPGWMWDDDPDYYNMPVTPLMLDFNVLELELSQDASGKLSASKALRAEYPGILTVDGGTFPSGRIFWRKPFEDKILVDEAGDLEKHRDSLRENQVPKLTANDPGMWISAVFTEMLRDEGVEVVNGPVMGGPPGPERPRPDVVLKGTPLGETLRHFNHASENAVGEVLLHEIAIQQGVERPNWSDGSQAITNWLVKQAGLNSGSFKLVDGSGLSRYNLISADSSVRLLAFMRTHKHYETFFVSLPEYELKLEQINWPGKPESGFDGKRVRAKSGGMSGVSTISGYLETLDGRQLAFSLLANGFIGSNKPVRDLRHQVWNTLVQFRAK